MAESQSLGQKDKTGEQEGHTGEHTKRIRNAPSATYKESRSTVQYILLKFHTAHVCGADATRAILNCKCVDLRVMTHVLGVSIQKGTSRREIFLAQDASSRN